MKYEEQKDKISGWQPNLTITGRERKGKAELVSLQLKNNTRFTAGCDDMERAIKTLRSPVPIP